MFASQHDIPLELSAGTPLATARRRPSPAPGWNPQSWLARPVQQAPLYPDDAALAESLAQLAVLPPLVRSDDIRALKTQLALVAQGKARLLQGGDCAESFEQFHADAVRDTHHTLTRMASVLGQHMPVVRVGRIAGQFAKPRSSPVERIGDTELPSYRGDIINGNDFDATSRVPDPQRMLQAYRQSAVTLNLLHGLDDASDTRLFSSHEALLLPYETALTRRDEDGRWYDGSAHMLWIGDRTRQLEGAHLEFCRGIANPIGLKCGPSMTEDELLRVLDVLDPEHEPGRVTLIVRLGAQRVRAQLAALVRAVQRQQRPVIWSCDPMHGNTVAAGSYKTRPFDRIADEVRAFAEVLRTENAHPGGLHLEMTGTDVTECIGGPQSLGESDLPQRYQTLCDPRLNATQALELARIAAAALRTPASTLESRAQMADHHAPIPVLDSQPA